MSRCFNRPERAMYDLHPPRVFVHRRVFGNRLAERRLERMLDALGNPPVEEVGPGDTDRIIEAARLREDFSPAEARFSQGIEGRNEDPVFLFNTFVWDEAGRSVPKQYANRVSKRIAPLMAGVGENFAFSGRELVDPNRAYVCQGGWGIHTLNGCVHRCAYCYEGYVVNFMLDLEEFADRLLALSERRPEQKVYRYDLYSDSICFEPEYGASAILSETFAKTADKYMLYYTKSDNVDHLLDLDKSRTIFYATLSTDSVCRKIELNTPSMHARIRGLQRCQQAGYVTRVGLSPIIPVRNWRGEATAMLEALLEVVKPDTLRLWVMSLMTCAQTEACIDPELLDPDFVRAMRQTSVDVVNAWNGPFPREKRAEVYAHYLDEIARISPSTPVSLCSEERAVWDMLAPRLRMSPDALYCCCGGTSVPAKRPRLG